MSLDVASSPGATRRPLYLAALLTPIVPACTLVALMEKEIGAGGIDWHSLDGYSLLGFIAMYLYALAFILVLGVPAFALLKRLRLVRWWSALVSGAVSGALIVILLTAWESMKTSITRRGAGECLLFGRLRPGLLLPLARRTLPTCPEGRSRPFCDNRDRPLFGRTICSAGPARARSTQKRCTCMRGTLADRGRINAYDTG